MVDTIKNRDEVQAAIQALAAIVGETEFKELIDDDFAASVMYRKDVAGSDSGGGSVSVSFLDIDYVSFTITGGVGVSITPTNVQQGEVKYLKITKAVGETVAFAGSTLEASNDNYITSLTEITFTIYNKDGNVQVVPITDTIPVSNETNKGIIEIASTAEAQGLVNDNNAITPAKLSDVNGGTLKKTLSIGTWDMNSNASPTPIAHGLTLSKIIGVRAIIINDAETLRTELAFNSDAGIGGGCDADATTIRLHRVTGGVFDAAGYGTTPSGGRGTIIVEYIP